MGDNNQFYMNLITSEYSEKPLFNAYVLAYLELISPIVDMLYDFKDLFSIDLAKGDQLDILGQLLGMTRILPIQDEDIPPVLPDNLFRLVLKARILANHWDGSIQGLGSIIDTLFPQTPYEIVDNQNMTMNITLITTQTDEVLALIQKGYILPKPAGVGVSFSTQDAAYFSWDADTAFIKGWDEGIWSNT